MTGIYFLLLEKEIVYIGQSTRFPSRLGGHADKNFDNFRFILCAENKLSEYEQRWIKKFNPIYNKKAGRPKMAENKRKKRFSVTLNPALLGRIERQITPTKGRNTLIEETLEEKFV